MTYQRDLFQLIFDASSLINIERTGNLGFIKKRKDSIIIPGGVYSEVNLPHSPLLNFIQRNPEMIAFFEPTEEEEYLRIRSQIGIHKGEAAAIALAVCRQLPLAIDDKNGKLKAESHGVRTLNWRDFIKGGL